MVRAMCGIKLMDRKNTDELMDMLRLNETLGKMAIANLQGAMVWSCFEKR